MELNFSLKGILNKNRGKILITVSLVILELISNLLIPLFIGFAINDLLKQTYDGLMILSILIIISVIIGTLRRFYDSRIYGGIFKRTSKALVLSEWKKQVPLSRISARIGLLNE